MTEALKGIAPIERTSVEDRVATTLRELIVSAPPGVIVWMLNRQTASVATEGSPLWEKIMLPPSYARLGNGLDGAAQSLDSEPPNAKSGRVQ